MSEAELLIKKHARIRSLRSLDALQLAVFSLLAEHDWKFALADDNLSQIIIKSGLQVILV